MVKKALLVGINYFGTNCELAGCINDISNMKQVLIKKYGFLESDMLILSDDQTAQVSHMPTCKNILAGINWLVGGSKYGDRLFMHYSGHGSYINDLNGEEKDGKDECICPCDYSSSGFIVDDVLRTNLTKIPAGCKLTCIYDSCHSGTIVDLRYNYIQSGVDTLVITKDLKYSNTLGDIIVFSGCEDKATSADTSETNPLTGIKQQQGAMTYAFIETLKQSNYNIKYKTLISRVRKLLRDKQYTQVPQMSTGKFLNIASSFSI